MVEDRNGGRVDDNGGMEREGQCQFVRTRSTVREKKTKWKKEEERRSWKNGREIRREGRGIIDTKEAKEEWKYRW